MNSLTGTYNINERSSKKVECQTGSGPGFNKHHHYHHHNGRRQRWMTKMTYNDGWRTMDDDDNDDDDHDNDDVKE